MTQNTVTQSSDKNAEWWRTEAIYEIFVRSFADGNGDGIGDIPGIISRLPYISKLGVDAIWLTPFYPSPQADTGYDVSNYCDVDPMYGTLADFDKMVETAHGLGLKVFIDIVPNHTSYQHPWFQAALKAAPNSAERNRYIFRDGKGANGELPPNNWFSWFGECAWTKVKGDKQWYLHMFSDQQPDLNWRNQEVRDEFDRILTFWLDRKVDGLRVDAPSVLIKPADFKDVVVEEGEGEDDMSPEDNLPELFPIYQHWRDLTNRYGARCIIGEVFPDSTESGLENYIEKGKMSQIFCFDFQQTPWFAEEMREIIDEWLQLTEEYETTPIWVANSHDLTRQPSRLGLDDLSAQLDGIRADDKQPDRALGERRARAMAMLMTWLPGSICLYYGEELGLPDDTNIKSDDVIDKMAERDGCRMPMPWQANQPAFGFSSTGKSWMKAPALYAEYAVDKEEGDANSTLALYRQLLKLRKELGLTTGEVEYLKETENDLIVARNGTVCLAINFGEEDAAMPKGTILAKSLPTLTEGGTLPGGTAVWLKQDWALTAADILEEDDSEDEDEDDDE